MSWWNTISVGMLLLVVTQGAEAQRPLTATVDSGLVVRAWMGNIETRGRLLEPMGAGRDSVRYCRYPGPPCQAPVRPAQLGWFRPAAFDHLDVQVGTRAAKGAIVGGVIGFLIGTLGGGLAQAFCEGQCPSDSEVLVKALVGGGLVGGGVGAVIGSGFPRFERRF